MEIRKAILTDINMLAENRLEFICTIRDIENKEDFFISTQSYLKNHLVDDSIISYIAVDDEKIVSSCILCIYDTLPIPSCLNGKAGLLLNVYTLKEYRHQGLAYTLLSKLIDEAKQRGVGKIHLDYTDDGYPLYKKLGFTELDREMVLKL